MKLLIITSRFPEPYETFILNEINILKDNFDVKVRTLKKGMPTDSDVECSYWWNPVYLIFFIQYMFIRPKQMILVFADLIGGFDRCPRLFELLKSLIVFPLACFWAKQAKKNNQKMILAHWCNVPSTIAWIIWRLEEIPYVMEVHGENISSIWNHLKKKLRCAHYVISCTKFNQKRINRILPDVKVDVCYHGINVPMISENQKILKNKILYGLTVGRLVETKGYLTLIQSLISLDKKNIDFRWTIVGEGPQASLIKEIVYKNNIDRKIVFKGHCQHRDVIDLYQKHDVFVLPLQVGEDGDSDGLPNVIIEAMAYGCPVITTPVGAVNEIIENNVNGILVEPRDPHLLEFKIKEVFENSSMKSKIITNARETVDKKLTHQHCSKRYLLNIKTVFESLYN